jgi:hypothetical protein
LKELTIRVWEHDELAQMFMAHFWITLTAVAEEHPEWVFPEITVLSVSSGKLWGKIGTAGVELSLQCDATCGWS